MHKDASPDHAGILPKKYSSETSYPLCGGSRPVDPRVFHLCLVADMGAEALPGRIDTTGEGDGDPAHEVPRDHRVYSGRAGILLHPGRKTVQVMRGIYG